MFVVLVFFLLDPNKTAVSPPKGLLLSYCLHLYYTCSSTMANELQELKDLVQQLRAENQRLQERNAADETPTDSRASSPVNSDSNALPSTLY